MIRLSWEQTVFNGNLDNASAESLRTRMSQSRRYSSRRRIQYCNWPWSAFIRPWTNSSKLTSDKRLARYYQIRNAVPSLFLALPDWCARITRATRPLVMRTPETVPPTHRAFRDFGGDRMNACVFSCRFLEGLLGPLASIGASTGISMRPLGISVDLIPRLISSLYLVSYILNGSVFTEHYRFNFALLKLQRDVFILECAWNMK